MVDIGKKAPAFSAPNQDGEVVKLSDYKGQWLVLYFYPRDDTPGCTLEANDFTALKKDFEKLDCAILGCSRDSEEKHCKFREKHGLKIDLLSDPDTKVLKAYNAWGLKKFMGKEFMGIIRSTYLIDPNGKIAYAWPKVRTKGHAKDVLEKLKELKD